MLSLRSNDSFEGKGNPVPTQCNKRNQRRKRQKQQRKAAPEDRGLATEKGKTMAEGEGSDPPPNRQRKTLKGIYHFMMEQTAQEDPTGPTQFQPMDEERRKWLLEVMRSVSVNVVGVMNKAIDVLLLQDNSEEVGQQKENALDELGEWVDNIDFGNDFHKIGGLEVIKMQLQSERSGVRSRSAQLIADLVQNNPEGQKAAGAFDLVADLLRLLDTDEDDGVRTAALAGLSAMLRDNPEGQKEFTDRDGFSVLLRAIQTNKGKMIIKGTFLLSALCREEPSFKDTLLNMGFVEQFVSLLLGEHDWTHEYITGALLSLVTGHSEAIVECRRPELSLRQSLIARIELIKGDDQYEEEQDHCQQLMELVFKDDDSTFQEER